MARLADAVGPAPFIFVVGKGGVGKTTAAGALALELADAGRAVHLVSTDPAHSIADLFEQPVGGKPVASRCTPRLRLEELDAAAHADAWLGRSLGAVTQLVESGTYLDSEDVHAFSRLALPGIDEMMAVLRLVDLARARSDGTIVVDTAPTGHTLRLLDAADTHEGIARALRAMADKAEAVAGSFAREPVRLTGAGIIDELNAYVAGFREQVLGAAAFVVATRQGDVIAAETARLIDELRRRELRVAAAVHAGARAADATPAPGGSAGARLYAPWQPGVSGCAGLRAWSQALATAPPAPASNAAAPAAVAAAELTPALPWLRQREQRLLLFGGKGGTGKSTCAAAAALALAGDRPVLLCSTDPAGSIDDVLGGPAVHVPQLRTLQIRPAAELDRLRDQYRTDVLEALEQLGLSQAASLDRRVIEALWQLTPPGVDELMATAAMLDAAETGELIIIDAAPTGHFLRLLSMPDVALDWVRQLMRVIVKYGLSGSAGGAAGSLLRLSRELRAIQQLLHDPQQAAAIVVTLDEPLVTAETRRLEAALQGAGVAIAAVLYNRARGVPALAAQHAPAHAPVRIVAPVADRPIGIDALREFGAGWNIVG